MKKTIIRKIKNYLFLCTSYCVMALVVLPIIIVNLTQKAQAEVITINSTNIEQTNLIAETTVAAVSPVAQAEINYTEALLTLESKNTELERYITGVVAAEMPALFSLEALKAQAVAARTYALNKMNNENLTISQLIQSNSQAYNSINEMKAKWGSDFNKYYEKVKYAVLSTADEVMVYNNEPILAVFHAISRGQTETAENIWQHSLPYLKSVDSSLDEKATGFIYEVQIPSTTVVSLLKNIKPELEIYSGNLKEQIQVIDKTQAGYINNIKIGNVVFTGVEVREALGLRSADFTVTQTGNNLVFTTKGYGHGCGMSQYGAKFMAEEGKNYKEILNHYYFNINFQNISAL